MRGRRRGEGSPPYGEVASSAVGRADVGIGPYRAIRGVVRDRVGRPQGSPLRRVCKRRSWSACRIRIHTHIHYIHPQKLRRVCRPQAAKNFKSFFTATCAWGKIPLRLPVWNFVACDKIMRAADCKPLWQKIPAEFSASKKKRRPEASLFRL